MTIHFPSVRAERIQLPTARRTGQGDFSRRVRPSSSYSIALKRAFDLTVVLLAAPIWIPIIVLMSLWVATDGHSPLFTQSRVGRNGRVYRMLKIRTMVPNAEERLAQHIAENDEARAEWDSKQKLKNDPRITRVGSFLRKSSLDELPQLLNVLRGDMSLVGPRPMMENQTYLYEGEAYYRLLPGVTGLWQISERNESTFADRSLFDAAYAEQMSFKYDLWILWRTVAVVFRCTGY